MVILFILKYLRTAQIKSMYNLFFKTCVSCTLKKGRLFNEFSFALLVVYQLPYREHINKTPADSFLTGGGVDLRME